jgi:hypothetical protein
MFMPSLESYPKPWICALSDRSLWCRAAVMGFVIGALQVAVNQGDHWWHWELSTMVLAKTVATPVITFLVSLFSGAASHAAGLHSGATTSIPLVSTQALPTLHERPQ